MNKLTIRADRLERLRGICLAMPEAAEKVAWGDPTWRVRDRIFVMQKGNYDGGRPSVWLKGATGAQRVLVEGDPVTFFVPPYVGKSGWVGVFLDGPSIDWDVLADLVEDSYRLIAPRSLVAKLEHASETPAKASRGRAPRRKGK